MNNCPKCNQINDGNRGYCPLSKEELTLICDKCKKEIIEMSTVKSKRSKS